MSTTALFYPHTTVVAPRRAGESQDYSRTDTKLLATALLLWDDLEVIVPWGGYTPNIVIPEDQKGEEKSIREAFDMVVRPRVVTREGPHSEMDRIHTELATLVKAGMPETLKFELKEDNYNFYPEKLSPEIWELLHSDSLAGDGSGGHRGVRRDLGLIIMGIVADVCAGKTRKKVTNYPDAHEAYCRLIATQIGAEIEFKPDVQQAFTRLASLSIKSVDAGALPLKKLVKLRKREKEDGLLPILRRNYREAVEKYVAELSTGAQSKADVEQIERDFERDMRDDFRHLQEMLELEVGGTLLTKGLSAVGAIYSGHLEQLTALVDTGPIFRLKKQGVLEKHKTAWLHIAA